MDDLFNLFGIEETEEDKKYTTKVGVPQYLPSAECPRLDSLVNLTKYKELLRNINASNVSEEEKEFLRLGATRHLVFTYSKIADYYAHANREMQRLLEQSAMVIIDINNALANGLVRLEGTLTKLAKEDDKRYKEEKSK